MSSERRLGHRLPLEIFLNEYVQDRLHRCVTTNVSESGLFLHKLVTPPRRPTRNVQLELQLPGTTEVIWARGEVAYERISEQFHGTGVRFSGMTELHARLLRDYIRERRKQQLDRLLDQIRRNRYH